MYFWTSNWPLVMPFSEDLLLIDLDFDISVFGLKFLMLVVSLLFGIGAELEVELLGGASRLEALLLSIDVHSDILGRAVVSHGEGDPFTFHASHEGVPASVPSEGATLVVEHG